MIKIKKLLFSTLILFILLAIPSFAYENYTCTTTYFDHTFNYNDNYVNNGWDAHYTCAFSGTRQAYPFEWNISGTIYNESFGINATIDCGTNVDFYHRLDESFSSVSSGRVLFKYNITLWNRTDGDAVNPAFDMRLYKDGTANGFAIVHGRGQNNYETAIVDLGGSSWNVEECTSNHNLSYATEYEVLMDLNLDTQTYTLYINKNEVDCTSKSLGVADEFSFLLMQQGYQDGETSFRETDDITICTGYLDSLPVSEIPEVTDIDSGVDLLMYIADADTTDERTIIGLLVLMSICGSIIWAYYIKGEGEGMGGILACIVIGFLVSILLTYVDLLPLWIPILWFILGGVGTFFAVKASLNGGS